MKRLDLEQVVRLFSLFSDLEGESLERWSGLCQRSAGQLERRLQPEVLAEEELEALCATAAACAYSDYLMAQGAAGQSEELRVGDISLKSSAENSRDAREIRQYFLEQVAYLLQPECPALLVVGDTP